MKESKAVTRPVNAQDSPTATAAPVPLPVTPSAPSHPVPPLGAAPGAALWLELFRGSVREMSACVQEMLEDADRPGTLGHALEPGAAGSILDALTQLDEVVRSTVLRSEVLGAFSLWQIQDASAPARPPKPAPDASPERALGKARMSKQPT